MAPAGRHTRHPGSCCRARGDARRGPRLGLAISLALSLHLSAQTFVRAPLEYQVKAAFLLNFVRFVQWPPEILPGPDAPIAVCVLRHNPFGDALEHMFDGERVAGRRVVARRIYTPDAAPACQILFVPRTVVEEDGPIAVPVLRGVLTVGESDAFLHLGGMISFYEEQGRIRFAIVPGAAERGDLRLSARLLGVARLVQQEDRP